MTIHMYLIQVVLIGGVASLLVRNSHWILGFQVFIWTCATAAIAARYGLIEQANFYSNDQRYHTEVVQTFTQQLGDVDFLISGSRLPYTFPAFLLYSVGLHPTLALKTVSLICLLLLTRNLRYLLAGKQMVRQLFILLITGCGTIGLFYSVLALRETMMMLFSTRMLLTRSLAERFAVALLLFLLRPHLAVSLVLACSAIWLLWKLRSFVTVNTSAVSLLVICGVLVGRFLYPVGARLLYGMEIPPSQSLIDGIDPLTRIASNFVGLQFLTAESETVEFSLRSLLLLRVVLVETILIPVLFTLVVFIKSQRLSLQQLASLLAFSIYVSLVTNTDFNSFRQNIPFMPIMGMTVLYLLRSPHLLASAVSSAAPLSTQRHAKT